MSTALPFEAIFNSAPVGNYLVSPTPEATILAVNEIFLKATARKREELIGVGLFDAFPDNPEDAVADSGAAALRNSLARVRATCQPDTLPRQRYPILITLPDGNKRFEERYWNAVNTPIFDQSGQLICISHTTVDITEQVRAEAAYQKSEGRYRSLSNSINDGFCIVKVLYDEQGNAFDCQFCEANPAFEQQSGLRNLAGKTMREFPALQETQWIATLAHVAQSGEPVRLVSEAKALGCWFELYAFRTDAPDTRQVAVLFKDITKHKKEEELLRSSERSALEKAQEAANERCRLAAVLEAAPVGIMVTDKQGAVIQANPENNRLWGVAQPRNPNISEYRKWKGWWADGSKRQGQRVETEEWAMTRALHGEPAPRDIIEIETFDEPPVRRTILNSGAPITDSQGTIIGAVVAQMDITERIKAETSLRETAKRLEFILNCAKIGEWDLDLIHDRSCRSLRHDQCFGYAEPVPEWGMRKFLEHVHPQDRAQVRQEFEKAVSGLDDGHVECRVIWPDGSVHWIAVHGSVYDQGGKPTRMVGIVYDITERKQAEDKLRESDRRKDEFLAMLAHELRNPLAPISAAAQLLKLISNDEARVAQTSDIITRQVQHMTSLVDDLLDVSRVTRGMVQLEKVPLDIHRIVAEAVEQINPLIHARQHHLVLHVPPQTAVVLGDKKRLVQIMANLLSNAAKYTPEGGHIVLQTQVLPEQVILSVEDDGIGMAPELIARVFELFTQAERSSDRSSGGLGLGLALVKSLVELHGGKVVCTSPGPGRGSRFTVCLPRLVDTNRPVERRQSPRYSLRTGKPLKIMVVDDNADAAQTLAMFLQASGHQVIVEHHPMLALEIARHEQPDVYMLDIGLPEMDGNELARQLRAQPESARAIMIAVTGYGQEHDRQKSIAAGFNHHMTKPIDMARLYTVLAALSPVKTAQHIQPV